MKRPSLPTAEHIGETQGGRPDVGELDNGVAYPDVRAVGVAADLPRMGEQQRVVSLEQVELSEGDAGLAQSLRFDHLPSLLGCDQEGVEQL